MASPARIGFAASEYVKLRAQKLLAERTLREHRMQFLEGWLQNIKKALEECATKTETVMSAFLMSARRFDPPLERPDALALVAIIADEGYCASVKGQADIEIYLPVVRLEETADQEQRAAPIPLPLDIGAGFVAKVSLYIPQSHAGPKK